MGIVKDNLYRISGKKLLWLVKSQTIFPYYHIVRDDKVAHIENLYRYKNIAQFKNDIDYLKKNFQPIDPAVLLSGEMPENAFLITFDDGLEEVYSVIFPILKEKGLNAIFFINPDFVDNNESLYKHDISVIISHLKKHQFDPELVQKVCGPLSINFTTQAAFLNSFKNTKFSERGKIKGILKTLNINMPAYLKENKPYLSKEQIQEMIDAGFYFGGHTMSHPPLTQLNHAEQKAEILNSIKWLKSNFGIDYSLFAFPFSDMGISEKLIDELFEYDKKLLLFGNSGLKKDINNRIIQRFSLENPNKLTGKQIVAENLYKLFNKLIGKYNIKRK